MSDDDALSWLDDGDDAGHSTETEEEFQDALDWLQESEDDDAPPAKKAKSGGGEEAGLDWLGGDDDGHCGRSLGWGRR